VSAFGLPLTGGFQWLLLETALNNWQLLSVRNGNLLLVPVEAFIYAGLLYAAW
jgi:hypothetical protein